MHWLLGCTAPVALCWPHLKQHGVGGISSHPVRGGRNVKSCCKGWYIKSCCKGWEDCQVWGVMVVGGMSSHAGLGSDGGGRRCWEKGCVGKHTCQYMSYHPSATSVCQCPHSKNISNAMDSHPLHDMIAIGQYALGNHGAHHTPHVCVWCVYSVCE